MSSGRKRRIYSENPAIQSLEESPLVRGALAVAFVAFTGGLILRVLADSTIFVEVERAAFGLAVALATVVVFRSCARSFYCSRSSRVLLVLGGSLGHVALCALVEKMSGGWGGESVPSDKLHFLLIPYALAPMLLGVLVGRGIGLLSTVFVSIVGALTVVPENALGYLVISLLSGSTAVMLTARVRKRGDLLKAGLWAGLVALVIALIWRRIELDGWSGCDGQEAVERVKVLAAGVAAIMGTSLFTALVISGLLPVFEAVFKLTTNTSWLELSDLNHKLLRRMQLEAPGTFHHSLVVASLSEAAAERVGANALVCRVCSLFHDIGKLQKPGYFIENIVEGVENPHDGLTPTMSALVILAHVKDGVDLAVKYKLNPRIINVIQEHHGDSLVYFFYRRAQERKKMEMERLEGASDNPDELPEVDEKNFRYPGPRPSTLESGIISLADSVESASRTLRKPTQAKIRSLIDDLVRNKINTGQLDDCPMTLGQLAVIKESFTATLRSMLHARIDYPKDEAPSSARTKTEPPPDASRETTGRETSGGKNNADPERPQEPRRSETIP